MTAKKDRHCEEQRNEAISGQLSGDVRYAVWSVRRRLGAAPAILEVEAEALGFPLINELFRRGRGRNAPPRAARSRFFASLRRRSHVSGCRAARLFHGVLAHGLPRLALRHGSAALCRPQIAVS